jgi:hypothetical protein
MSGSIFDEALKMHKDQWDEVALCPFVIFKSPKKLGNGFEEFL